MGVIDAVFRWQAQGYAGHLGDPAEFPHRHTDVPAMSALRGTGDCKRDLRVVHGRLQWVHGRSLRDVIGHAL